MKDCAKFNPENLKKLDISKAKCKFCEKPMKPEPEWLLLESGEISCTSCISKQSSEEYRVPKSQLMQQKMVISEMVESLYKKKAPSIDETKFKTFLETNLKFIESNLKLLEEK